MRRIERRLLRINDELERLRRERELVEGELEMHRHLADDAVRDAAVSQGLERREARDALKDVAGQERALAATRDRIAKLEAKRDALLDRLSRG
ncbi:MAG: hypothetical protein ABR600_09580 [Actinomycetota bacterium]